jgi:ATP-dependent RNA helicase DeaD
MSPHDTSHTDNKAFAVSAPAPSVSEPEDAPPPLDLEALSAPLRTACANAGWTRLMPVQAYALPYLLAGRDLMVQSRTGSGKTGAYLLPLIDRINAAQRAVQALVLVPTRELALQVEHEANILASGAPLSAVAVYGGVGYGRQMEALRQGVQLVVGTPGRVLDHLLRRTMTLDALSALVLDEADRMLSIGFYPDMKEVQRYLPKRRVLTSFFSATYPPHVLQLADEFLRDPSMLSLSHNQVHVAESEHILCECRPMDKDRALVRILETENPASAIIFCNTKANVHYVTAVLQGFGYDADELCADLSQSKREAVLAKTREGRLRYLVATDVAARGIDIPELSHVIL